jgi:hypothetical protein
METRVPLFSIVNARTVSFPIFLFAGWLGPTPPEIGRIGSGVTSRTAMAARNAARASQTLKKHIAIIIAQSIHNRLRVLLFIEHSFQESIVGPFFWHDFIETPDATPQENDSGLKKGVIIVYNPGPTGTLICGLEHAVSSGKEQCISWANRFNDAL